MWHVPQKTIVCQKKYKIELGTPFERRYPKFSNGVKIMNIAIH